MLEILADSHPLPQAILDYRQVQKLQSTYVEALPKMVSPRTGRRAHGLLAEHGGDGASVVDGPEPPEHPDPHGPRSRAPQGVHPGPRNMLVSVDYSQIELRVLAGTFLEDAPILPVSAISGEGLEEFKALLFGMAKDAAPRGTDGVFRMPVQRVFSKQGFGTVLTGIPVSGTVEVGDVLEVQPSGQRGKVRGIQAYKEATDSACAGHSTAINLTDIDRHGVNRGAVVATPGFFKAVSMVGAKFFALKDIPRPVANRTPVRVHVGTAEAVGEIVPLDCEEIQPGTEALIQLRLEEPIVCAPGDPFILRLASPALTLGGGVIVEESRYRLKRFKDFVLDELSQQKESLDSLSSLLEVQLSRKRLELVPTADLAFSIKRSPKETLGLLRDLKEKGHAWSNPAEDRWVHSDRMQDARERLFEAAGAWFEANPHRKVMDIADLRREMNWEATLFAAILEAEKDAGRLSVQSGGKIALAGREVELDPETQALLDAIAKTLTEGGFQPPEPGEIAARVKAPEKRVREILALMCDMGQAGRVGGDLFVGGSELERARQAIISNCEKNGSLVIPELRDALATTRKYLIPLLEYFDAQGVTLRQGGNRVLKRT